MVYPPTDGHSSKY